MTAAQTEQDFETFVRGLATADRNASADMAEQLDTDWSSAEWAASAEWAGEHTTALADHLGCTVAELDESDIDAARRIYRAAAKRIGAHGWDDPAASEA